MAVPNSDTTMEPRQPSLLEKKMNTRGPLQSCPQAGLWRAMLHSTAILDGLRIGLGALQ
jgi:hypothetical protein